ncbi:MAG: hypothetical protein IJT49_08885 [Clostridia bacterium]|nr:hypothetical protein [Clostridia bacterium]
MHKGRKLLSAFLALAVLCTFFASVSFIVHEADHHCTGEHCPVCAAIAVCRTFIGTLCLTAVLSVCFLMRGTFSRIIRAFHIFSGISTPVSLRVKLLN